MSPPSLLSLRCRRLRYFLVAPFPEFNDAEDAAGSASVLRNVLFCQRVTDTVIDMLHATCGMLHTLLVHTNG